MDTLRKRQEQEQGGPPLEPSMGWSVTMLGCISSEDSYLGMNTWTGGDQFPVLNRGPHQPIAFLMGMKEG